MYISGISTHDVLDTLFDVFQLSADENEHALIQELMHIPDEETRESLMNRESQRYYGECTICCFISFLSSCPSHSKMY